MLDGRDGADTLYGVAGDDTIDGGAGIDLAVYTGSWSDYTITENAGVYTIVDNRPGSPDGTDTVTNVENFSFADGTISFKEILNDAPIDISVTGGGVDENSATGTVVATLATTDADTLDSHSYNLTSDASGFFEIVGNEIRVKTGATIDYEAATSHDVTVEVTDAGGNTYSEVITLNVNDLIDEGPTDITLSNTEFQEGFYDRVDVEVGTLGTVDPDCGDTFSYPIVSDPSGPAFIDDGT